MNNLLTSLVAISLLLSVNLITGCLNNEGDTAEDANKNAEFIIIDVRTASEYIDGHIKESINIPYNEIISRISECCSDKSAEIKVYCRSGNRSSIAKRMLEAEGWKNITDGGGYKKMIAAGYLWVQ